MLLISSRSTSPNESSNSNLRSIITLKRGDHLQSLSEYWKVESGIVRSVSWDEEGHLHVLGIWGVGDLIGHASERIVPYQLECLANATVSKMTNFYELPDLLLRRQQITEELLNLAYARTVSDRLFRTLRWLGDRFGCPHQVRDFQGRRILGRLVEIRLTHQQLADLAGTTRVTVTRLLSELEKSDRILRMRRGHFLIVEQQAEWG
jgi:CRP-like cAMP-binding protein